MDTIDRQAAIDVVKGIDSHFVKYIEAVPSAQPMRKRGEWHKQDNGQIYWYECSVCGCEPLRNKWNGDWEFSDFCPNCGADMRGDADETD